MCLQQYFSKWPLTTPCFVQALFCGSNSLLSPWIESPGLDRLSCVCFKNTFAKIRGRQPSQAPDWWSDFPLLFRMNSGFDIPSSPKRVWLPLATFWIFWHQSSTHFMHFIEQRVWNDLKVPWPCVPLEYTVREMGSKWFGGSRWKAVLLFLNSKWTERL